MGKVHGKWTVKSKSHDPMITEIDMSLNYIRKLMLGCRLF